MKKVISLCVLLLSLNSILSQTILSDNSLSKNLVRILVILILLFLIIVNNSLIKREFLFLGITLAGLLVVSKNSDILTYIFLLILVQVLFELKEKDIIKIIFFASMVPVIIIFMFLILGITENEVVVFRNRMTFGLGADRVPYFFNIIYGALVTTYIFIEKKVKKINLLRVILFMIATYFSIKTDIRGGYISFIIFLILPIFLKHIQGNYKILIRFLLSIVPITLYLGSFLMITFKDNYNLNKILSYRPMLIGRFLKNIKPIDFILTKSVKEFDQISIVDNTYIHLLIGGGIVMTIYFLIKYFNSICNLFYQDKITEISFITATSFYFYVESIGLRIENVFVILFWYIIIKHGGRRTVECQV